MSKATGAMDRNSIWPDVQPVRQGDGNGCVIACLAMITGRTYADVKRELGKHAKCAECGITDDTTVAFLSEHGFSFSRLTPRTFAGRKRAVWPPEPFADVHIAGVRSTLYCRDVHAVLWLRDGRVFDPEYRTPMRLDAYDDVLDVIGVYLIDPTR